MKQAPIQVVSTRKQRTSGYNPLLNLPIAWRLTLGFLAAALIAVVASGIIGTQRTNTLSSQSNFYQNLVRTNTNLTTGSNLLQLMTNKSQGALDEASSATPSQETIANDLDTVHGLINRYDTIVTNFINHDLIEKHPDQVAFLSSSVYSNRSSQQRALANSSLQTWNTYRGLQEQVLQNIVAGNTLAAHYIQQFQAEATNADASSALSALVQFNQLLTSTVNDAVASDVRNESIITIIVTIIAFLGIALVGVFISRTIVQRLNQLLRFTQEVEGGALEARIYVYGRDEIGRVSASTNAMLEAINRLLNETRSQRDALTNAAEHLFSDIRVVSAGDLRVSNAGSEDPIGLLANAFNFTLGRFQRFALRTQTAAEQLDVISRQELDRSETFKKVITDNSYPSSERSRSRPPGSGDIFFAKTTKGTDATIDLLPMFQSIQAHLKLLDRVDIMQYSKAILDQADHVQKELDRLMNAGSSNIALRATRLTSPGMNNKPEFSTLYREVEQITMEAKQIQKLLNAIGDLDADVHQLLPALRQASVQISSNVTPFSMTTEHESAFTKVSSEFAQEAVHLAHQLMALSKELRNNVASFQIGQAGTMSRSGQVASSNALSPGMVDQRGPRPEVSGSLPNYQIGQVR